MEDFHSTNQESQSQNLREILAQYLRYWPWFIFSVIIALSISFIYLRYTTSVYQTKATILIKDERNSALSEMAAFQDLGLAGSLSPSGFENEIIVLQSKSLIERVVKDLRLNIRYFSEGNIQQTELFGNVPINVTSMTSSDGMNFRGTSFYVLPVSEFKFQFWTEEETSKKEYNFGDTISLPTGDIMITPNLRIKVQKDELYSSPIKVVISSIYSTVASYRNSIKMEQLTPMSSVIQLTMNSANTLKSEAVLNELIKQYNKDAIEDRNLVAKNTAEFINGRLVIISEELDSVETGKVEFKQSNRLTDIAVESGIFLQSESQYTNSVLEVETQIELVRTMIDYVKNGNEFDLLPSNLGIQKEGAMAAIASYNQAVLARNRLLSSSTEKNPAVVELNNQIMDLKASVIEGLTNAKISLEITKNDLYSREKSLGSKISTIPKKEKIFRGIMRQQEIKEALYLYLLQKREENAISMAVTTPKAKVVDYGYSSIDPIFPKRNVVRLGAIIAGLLIPFLIIYGRSLLDNKIRDKHFIERKTEDTSVIGEIPKVSENVLVQKNDRSVFAESFRILRTNLQYLFVANGTKTETGKSIFITSSVKGEGKTLISINLALTIANTGAKVILVGGDIRNPQLHRYIPQAPYKRGVVEYLIHEDTTIQDYIYESDLHENLTMMFSGTVPPNPAELWLHDRAEVLFSELRNQFDFVIVDTAPAMMVTDTFLINKYADVTLFVMRAGYTQKNLINFAMDSIKTKRLKNVAFVLNNVNHENLGYGNKYGYYYTDDPRTKWDKIKRSLRFK
jgi:capsular exopolysaccharide synthesis family protein